MIFFLHNYGFPVPLLQETGQPLMKIYPIVEEVIWNRIPGRTEILYFNVKSGET